MTLVRVSDKYYEIINYTNYNLYMSEIYTHLQFKIPLHAYFKYYN